MARGETSEIYNCLLWRKCLVYCWIWIFYTFKSTCKQSYSHHGFGVCNFPCPRIFFRFASDSDTLFPIAIKPTAPRTERRPTGRLKCQFISRPASRWPSQWRRSSPAGEYHTQHDSATRVEGFVIISHVGLRIVELRHHLTTTVSPHPSSTGSARVRTCARPRRSARAVAARTPTVATDAATSAETRRATALTHPPRREGRCSRN